LLSAVRRYDAGLNTPFWAYASFWVRKAMQELVAEVTRPVALSDRAARSLARLRAARRDHVRAHGADPTSAEMVNATGFSLSQLASLQAVERRPRAMEEPVSAGPGTTTTFGDTIIDPSAERAYQRVLDQSEVREVRELAGQLDERERAVIWAHFGLGQPARTLNQIGGALGLTAERARQIEVGALDKLRARASDARDDRLNRGRGVMRPLFGGVQRTGGRDDLRDEDREVLRGCVGVQDAGAQRLAAAEDGPCDEGAAAGLNRLR
jgi:RNA polymerase primary sigma factor